MRIFLWTMLLSTVCLAAPQPGDEGTPEFQAASALVKDLGDARFATRETAAKKLLEMGATALPALRAGARSSDEEVRNRAAAMLPQIVTLAWNRRADAFLADVDQKQKHDLPLLADWEKVAGKPDAGTRKLFADMIRAHGPLFELAATDRKAAAVEMANRSAILLDAARAKGKQVDAPAASVAGLLFVQTLLRDQPAPAGDPSRHEPLHLLANPAVAAALDAKDVGPAYRRLIVQWAESRPLDETMTGLFFAILSHRHPFPEADARLFELATKHKSVQIKWVALEALGRSKVRTTIDKLTELLNDKSAMYEDLGEQEAGHQVRDCALAALIAGQGKNPADYRLQTYMTANFWAGGTADTVTLHLCGFKTAGDREIGIKKWLAESAAKQ
ncbi:MAG TPA: hypothetical protein VHR66_01750 [Gemmataceae bacterium]|jgi:HEAT repeat protein|nr:hypothetical protein [Gemmataceae bacterium]